MMQELEPKIDQLLEKVKVELVRAGKKHPPLFHSPAEALGVILEEFEEFKDEIKADEVEFAKTEANQLAAMAVKFILSEEVRAEARRANMNTTKARWGGEV